MANLSQLGLPTCFSEKMEDEDKKALNRKEAGWINGPWSPEEDETLEQLVLKHGPRNWSLISKSIPGRSGKSCRRRWCNHLSPHVAHRPFTPEEDDIIASLYISIGGRWSIIARNLNGRTDNATKNYWNSTLKPKLLNSTPNAIMKKKMEKDDEDDNGGDDDHDNGGDRGNNKKESRDRDRDGRDRDGDGDKDKRNHDEGGGYTKGKNMDFMDGTGFGYGYAYHAGNENGCPVEQLQCAQVQSSNTKCSFYHAIMVI